ncbi:hypothetical protein CD798_15130 [Bacillaceae bacterium SAOS 7]|nr:hypothetical protein CD798_15130 [Bacillaceae bacterium SAOS 7]
MKRGLSFEIPNESGSFLEAVLRSIDITMFNWRIGSCESYLIVGDELGEEIFSEGQKMIEGVEFKSLLQNNKYYIIFADLRAYPKSTLANIETYEEFLNSECELVLLVVDSCYVTIYCKSNRITELLYRNAKECGFEDVQYITNEDDTRTRLSIW